MAYWYREMVSEVSGERRRVTDIGGRGQAVVMNGGGFRCRKVVVGGGGG